MDGPATSFEAGALVKSLIQKDASHDDSTYGLVLVAGWPVPRTWQEIYATRIRPRLAACFPDDEDHTTVYMYPPEALHVTLANFGSIHHTTDIPQNKQASLEKTVTMVVRFALRLASD